MAGRPIHSRGRNTVQNQRGTKTAFTYRWIQRSKLAKYERLLLHPKHLPSLWRNIASDSGIQSPVPAQDRTDWGLLTS